MSEVKVESAPSAKRKGRPRKSDVVSRNHILVYVRGKLKQRSGRGGGVKKEKKDGTARRTKDKRVKRKKKIYGRQVHRQKERGCVRVCVCVRRWATKRRE